MHAVDVVKQLYRAFADDDVSAMRALLDPDIEWIEAEGYVYGGIYRGRDAVLEGVVARDRAEWEGFTASPERFISEGDNVVTVGWYSATYRATQKAFSARFAHWYVVRDDRIVRFEQVVDSAKVQECLSA
jgi:uncharacterized protein